MKINKNIAYVGTLQYLGRPFSMLFVDKEIMQLYIFVRISDGGSDRFIVTDVSPDEVESYMNEELGLINMLSHKSLEIADIDNGVISFENLKLESFTPSERIKKMNLFDPDLCDDDVWLEVFLNRINNNQPIEIA